MRIEPDPDLVWYFQQSSSDLGMKASCWSDTHSSSPKQNWPTERQTRAATRQRAVRAALRGLSPQLQSVLECAYETKAIPVDATHKYDLAAHLIERAARSGQSRAKMEEAVRTAPMLLIAAHTAFRISFGPPTVRGRAASIRTRVARWVDEVVDAA